MTKSADRPLTLPGTLTLRQFVGDPENKATYSDIARAMKVTPGAVWQWAEHETRPMLQRCRYLMQATGGRVTGEEWYPEETAYFASLLLATIAVAGRANPSQPAGAPR